MITDIKMNYSLDHLAWQIFIITGKKETVFLLEDITMLLKAIPERFLKK